MPIIKKPIPKLTPKQYQNFMKKVVVCESGCWEWSGCLNNGYGVFAMGRTPSIAHRISYREFVGDLVPIMDIDHKCRNTKCVNPAHLQQVTHEKNLLIGNSPAMIRMREKEQTKLCSAGHDLSNKENLVSWSKRLKCKICFNKNARDAHKRRGGKKRNGGVPS